MLRFIIFSLICIVFIVAIWFLLRKIRIHWLRILLRSGLLAIVFTPTYDFDGKHIAFFPAWTQLGYKAHFLSGFIPIIMVWGVMYLIGLLFFFIKKRTLHADSSVRK
jgi:hypothetical protein